MIFVASSYSINSFKTHFRTKSVVFVFNFVNYFINIFCICFYHFFTIVFCFFFNQFNNIFMYSFFFHFLVITDCFFFFQKIRNVMKFLEFSISKQTQLMSNRIRGGGAIYIFKPRPQQKTLYSENWRLRHDVETISNISAPHNLKPLAYYVFTTFHCCRISKVLRLVINEHTWKKKKTFCQYEWNTNRTNIIQKKRNDQRKNCIIQTPTKAEISVSYYGVVKCF